MSENVIVTVVYEKRQIDMELPANVPIEAFTPQLVSTLCSKGVLVSPSLVFYSNNRVLDTKDTLLHSGVWDGSYLELKDRS